VSDSCILLQPQPVMLGGESTGLTLDRLMFPLEKIVADVVPVANVFGSRLLTNKIVKKEIAMRQFVFNLAFLFFFKLLTRSCFE
jgi:hypothetical protein